MRCQQFYTCSPSTHPPTRECVLLVWSDLFAKQVISRLVSLMYWDFIRSTCLPDSFAHLLPPNPTNPDSLPTMADYIRHTGELGGGLAPADSAVRVGGEWRDTTSRGEALRGSV